MISKKILIIGLLIAAGIIPIFYFFLKPPEPVSYSWFDDSSFDTSIDSPWFSLADGDLTDVDANISNNYANYRILGDFKTYNLLSGGANSSTWYGWAICNNSDFLLPDKTAINESGCYVYHFLDESEGPNDEGQVHNFPSVHFKKNISLSVDMSDYEINSASLKVLFNASVGSNVDAPGDTVGQSAIWDSATFYVEISDLNNSYAFRVAENKTKILGQDDPPILNITDRELTYVSESDLITALNLALEKDESHSKFTIILGMDIYCEDNDFPDYDLWNALIIKSCNLSFSYEKKTDYSTKISWNQDAEKISGENIQIRGALFNFKYKIDKSWPTDAPLSEMRFFINDKLFFAETIKLSALNSSFQEISSTGLNVLDFIEKDVNVSISIEIFLKDTFELNETITISIDDVYLYIELIELVSDWTLIVYLLVGGIAGLVLIFTLYETHFKFPPMIRKVRKLRKKIRKNKKINKPIIVKTRTDVVKSNFITQIKNLELEHIERYKEENSFRKADQANNNKNLKEEVQVK